MRMIFAVVASLAFTAAAEAATFRLGTPPVAAITLPDDWDTDEIDRGVESTSKDEEIYIAAEVASISKLEDAVTQAVAYLISEGVRIDQKTEKRSEGKIGGLDAFHRVQRCRRGRCGDRGQCRRHRCQPDHRDHRDLLGLRGGREGQRRGADGHRQQHQESRLTPAVMELCRRHGRALSRPSTSFLGI